MEHSGAWDSLGTAESGVPCSFRAPGLGMGVGATERLAWSAPVLLPLAGHEIARGGHAAERNSLKTRLGVSQKQH